MAAQTSYVPRRYVLLGLGFGATFICYIDRVNISVAIIPMAEQFGWTESTKGLVLSSFFVGYVITQVLGGRLSDRYGGKLVLGAGVLIWSLFTVLTPPAVFGGFALLIACRIAMGLGEAVTIPSIYSMVSRWIPARERTRAVAFFGSGLPLGTVFALVVTPIIVQAYGWEWAFYSFGAAGLVWYFFWSREVTTSPQDHPKITPHELELIRDGASAHQEAGRKAPWGRFLRSAPVWAILVAQTCGNWSTYVLLAWLPTFVTQGLGVDFAAVGVMSMLPHLGSFLGLNATGVIADRLLKTSLSTTAVRKLMQTLGMSGLVIALVFVTELESAWAAIGVMSIGTALAALAVGGHGVNHMDIAPDHAGTLMGITNTAASMPGIVGVWVTGWILDTTGSWDLVFRTAAAVAVFGMVFYLVFASGRRQQFD